MCVSLYIHEKHSIIDFVSQNIFYKNIFHKVIYYFNIYVNLSI